MTFEEAIGRIFAFRDKRFYVVKSQPIHGLGKPEDRYIARVIDLETSCEIFMWNASLKIQIPEEWKEILP